MKRHCLTMALKFVAAGCLLVAVAADGTAAEKTQLAPSGVAAASPPSPQPRAAVGAYYFDGWAGSSERWKDDPQWTKLNPPTHLTKRMLEEFADREPVWGWRDDSLELMERQIDLAADNGINFFAFCWYWNKDQEKLAKDPKHTGLQLFLKAKNNQRMKFCLLVANHAGHLFQDADEWGKAAAGWLPYFKHPRHVTVDGKPLVIIFNARNADQDGLAQVQTTARKAGLPGVAIAACGNSDAKIGFTHSAHYNIVPGYAAGSEARKYAEVVESHERAWRGTRDQPYIPTLTVGWDKRPWEGERGLGQKPGWYFPDRTPEQFANFLDSAITWMDEHPEQTTAERLVLLYAWNELGEGGFLAPTKGDPNGAYLKAVKQVVQRAGPSGPQATRILFLGNSITRHGPSAKVGWPNNWGMAASALEKDYVHIMADALAKQAGRPPRVRIENISEFERKYDTFDFDAGLKPYLDFKPDIVVVAIGENVPALATDEAKTKFNDSLGRLLKAFKDNGQPEIYVRSSFWPNKAKDDILQKSCAAVGGTFVDISGLGKDESNYARSERSYEHAGVAAHPGDKGMKAIADALLKAMAERQGKN